jgi:hypothetical protein
MTGQAAAGLGVLEEAWVPVHNHGIRDYEAELYRLKGELMLALTVENHAEAAACFHHALDIARQLLADVYGWFTEGFDTADLQAAKALLEALA